MRRVVWRSIAEQDLQEAHAYIAAGSFEAAERFVEAVLATLEVLRRSPEVGRLREFKSEEAAGVRSFVVAGFPSYLLIYRAVPEELEVVRLLHGARDLPELVREEGVEVVGMASSSPH